MRFRPTHEIRLTGRLRRGRGIAIPVMVDAQGVVWTADEWRTGSLLHAWTYDGEWHGPVPEGYTTVRVKRPGMGPTMLRGGGESASEGLTIHLTPSTMTEVRRRAKAERKKPARWAAEAVERAARKR